MQRKKLARKKQNHGSTWTPLIHLTVKSTDITEYAISSFTTFPILTNMADEQTYYLPTGMLYCLVSPYVSPYTLTGNSWHN